MSRTYVLTVKDLTVGGLSNETHREQLRPPIQTTVKSQDNKPHPGHTYERTLPRVRSIYQSYPFLVTDITHESPPYVA